MTKTYEQTDRAPLPTDTPSEADKTIFVPHDSDYAADEDDHLGRLKSATIMMVDDEAITTEVIQTFLDDEGYSNFVTTDQSTEALALLEKTRPDVVLLDLMMPEVSGFDILKAMRADPDLKHIPVIVLTSATDGDTKLKVLEIGASDFLAKPVDPSELALRLRNTLAAKAYQNQLDTHDALTGLPTRRMFLDLLKWALKRAERAGRTAALLHIHLDRDQKMNNALGHGAGDVLLREIARRLQGSVRASDAVGKLGEHRNSGDTSRFGGEGFVVLLPETNDVENAAGVARRILAALAEPVHVGDCELCVTPSIGIALYPDDGGSTEELLESARLATSRAKQNGRSAYRFFSDEINAKSTERSRLRSELSQALSRNELVLHYQPRVNTETRRLTGVEALLRWNHAERGMVPPSDFLALVQELGLIVSIGEWVLNEACQQNRVWQSAGLSTLTVSVNVTAHQLRDEKFTVTLRDALERSGLDPRFLTLELTESTIMENAQQGFDVLHEAKKMGVMLSIDDFGTGHSSLSWLKRFPVDELKIDHSFFAGGQLGAGNAAMVTAIIEVAHSLGLTVVAEGVESKRQWEFLKQKRCDQCQGSVFSMPCAADALSARIEKPDDVSSDGGRRNTDQT